MKDKTPRQQIQFHIASGLWRSRNLDGAGSMEIASILPLVEQQYPDVAEEANKLITEYISEVQIMRNAKRRQTKLLTDAITLLCNSSHSKHTRKSRSKHIAEIE